MPAVFTVGNIYELVDVQAFQGQEVLNVYFYRVQEIAVSTLATAAQVLGENWIDQILPDIAYVQVADLVHTGLRVRNLFVPGDAWETSVSVPGVNESADYLPIFDAFKFTLDGETHDVRKGRKSIAGISESVQTNGVVTDTGTLTDLGNTSDALARAVQVGLILPSDVFFPCLVKRVRSGVAGAYTYELPTDVFTSVSTQVISALFDVLISSQVSRKIGVGA